MRCTQPCSARAACCRWIGELGVESVTHHRFPPDCPIWVKMVPDPGTRDCHRRKLTTLARQHVVQPLATLLDDVHVRPTRISRWMRTNECIGASAQRCNSPSEEVRLRCRELSLGQGFFLLETAKALRGEPSPRAWVRRPAAASARPRSPPLGRPPVPPARRWRRRR